MSLLYQTVNDIFDKPSKLSGKPRFGQHAKIFYCLSNIPKLYKSPTLKWINSELDKNTIESLQYQFYPS